MTRSRWGEAGPARGDPLSIPSSSSSPATTSALLPSEIGASPSAPERTISSAPKRTISLATYHPISPLAPHPPSSITPFPLTSPLRKFDAHDSAVTAIASNGVVITTGSARGAIHAYDALTLERVRTFDALETRSASGFVSPLSAVSAIAFSSGEVRAKDKEKNRDKETREMLLATVGDEVLAWQLGKVPKSQRHIMVGAKGKGRAWRERVQYEQKIEIKEGMASAWDARGSARDASGSKNALPKQARVQQAKMDALGLDETEALEYVMMLSREEAAQREREAEWMRELFGDARAPDEGPSSSMYGDGSSAMHGGDAVDGGVFDGDFDAGLLADDGSPAGVDDSPGSSGISSLSYASSSSGGRTDAEGGQSASPPAGRPIPLSGRPIPHSGRPIPHSGRSIPASTSRTSLPVTSARASPPTTSVWALTSPPSPSSAPATLDDEVAFPPVAPHTPASSVRRSPPPSSVRPSPPSSVPSAWSTPLRMTPGSNTRRVSGASTPPVRAPPAVVSTAAPLLRSAEGAWGSATASGLAPTSSSVPAPTSLSAPAGAWAASSTTGVPSEPSGPSVEDLDNMDDDLRYAILLSLAEARSRGEAV